MPDATLRAAHSRSFWCIQACIWIVFGRSLTFGLTNWDDYEWIVSNELVTHPGGGGWLTQWLTQTMGYPQGAVVATQAFDHWIGGGAAWTFHATNVALHSFNAALLWVMCARFGLRGVARVAAVGIWAIHPLAVEPVCWATGRKDLLLTFLTLVAVECHARWLDTGRSAWSWGVLGVSAACFATKPTSVALPLLLVVEILRRGRHPTRREWLWIAPAWVGAMALGWASLDASRDQGAVEPFAIGAGLARAASHLGFQLGHVVFPARLSPHHPWPSGWIWPAAGTVAIVAAIIAIRAAWSKRRLVRVASLSWAIVTFAPASGVVALVRGPADSYAYLPLIGLTTWLGTYLPQRFSARSMLALVAALAVPAAVASDYAGTYRRSSALWQRVVDVYPESELGHQALGDALIAENQLARAVPHLERAVELSAQTPDPEALRALARACHALDRHECATRMYGTLASSTDDLADALCFAASFEKHPLQELHGAYESAWARASSVLAAHPDPTSRARALGRPIELDGVLATWVSARDPKVSADVRRILRAGASSKGR